jgi:cobyric acid synthase CobQ/nicotinate-nucleotide--dimethylbenzimidazole phosphoribosyltransferase/5,6-dimethylbenzimidazole synthase
MVQGTASNAGKSVVATALARALRRRGIDVVPFKAQNMSNNARVVAGGEIGTAQWLQALAAGLEPEVRMNPVLVKPEGDDRSQVVVLGRPDAELSRLRWRERPRHLWPAIESSLRSLAAEHELVLLEGAGSPAEINLRSTDLANMSVAQLADARTLLVADIDRGGAFAHLYGTWALLDEDERRRIDGFVLNKFRGDASLLAPGPEQLAELTGVRTLGVLPWLDHGLPDEDGAATPALAPGLRVAVVRYPTASNLDELKPVESVASLRWTASAGDVRDADLVVLPGSKNVDADLAWLRAHGLADAVAERVRAGGRVLGICGGLQLLGALGLLDVETTYADEKLTEHATVELGPIEGPWSVLSGRSYRGYEIRHGTTRGADGAEVRALARGPVLAVSAHGLFEDDAVLAAVFGRSRERTLEEVFDGLADAVEEHLDLDALLRGRFDRPKLPAGFDESRARERGGDPAGWAFPPEAQEAVRAVIAARRDIRRFRPDAVPADVLERILVAAHQAPSVGLSQPWRFVLVEGDETKAAMHALAARERLVQRDHFDERARQFLDLKIEGIREAPLSICVCCERPAGEVLGRHTIRDTDLYSTCCAIENLWLAARAEGVGVGWVSFYREEDVRALLGLPGNVVPVAWLCVGYPDERPERPGLEAAGWDRRRTLGEHVVRERWAGAAERGPLPPVTAADTRRTIDVRDRSDELVKPAGSLGALEALVERWAAATGAPPPPDPRPALAIFAADHGVAARGASLFPARVSAQVAAAAGRGETAIGVLARAHEARLEVVDVGLGAGTADFTTGPAMTRDELDAALERGRAVAAALAADADVLIVGEIGIGNTTAAAALLAALTGLPPAAVCGRGTGLDAQGLERKRALVAEALAVNAPDRNDPLGCLRAVGGLELAALVGAVFGAAAARTPVLLDGFATGVAALATARVDPLVRDYLFAGHRSAEPAHGHVLVELGLEPLLDLRLRLGEGSGAALAFPLIGLAGRLYAEMRTFDDARVEQR